MQWMMMVAAWWLGCGGDACPDCGPATTCAVPFCTEDGECDPGYLTLDLRDDQPGDCQAPVCRGDQAEPGLATDSLDRPADTPCGVGTCNDGVPEIEVVARGQACATGTGVCSGDDETAASCVTCVDDQVANYAVDIGCTPEQNRCDEDANVCVGPTTWDLDFGTLAFSADGTTVTNPFGQNDNGSNARSSVGVDSGAYYWEIEVVEGDASINDGGVGVLRSDMGAVNFIGNNYYAYDEGGLSFGYGTGGNTIYYWNWPGATLQPITPPLGSAVNQGVVYMFALDMDNQRLWAGQDGSWHSGDPSTGQAPLLEGLDGTVHAGVTLYGRRSNTFRGNFMGPFTYPVPTGFQAGLY